MIPPVLDILVYETELLRIYGIYSSMLKIFLLTMLIAVLRIYLKQVSDTKSLCRLNNQISWHCFCWFLIWIVIHFYDLLVIVDVSHCNWFTAASPDGVPGIYDGVRLEYWLVIRRLRYFECGECCNKIAPPANLRAKKCSHSCILPDQAERWTKMIDLGDRGTNYGKSQ